MAERLHYSLTNEPELLDVIDDEWLRASLPDDGALSFFRHTFCSFALWQQSSLQYKQTYSRCTRSRRLGLCKPFKLAVLTAFLLQTFLCQRAFPHLLTITKTCGRDYIISRRRNGANWGCTPCTDVTPRWPVVHGRAEAFHQVKF